MEGDNFLTCSFENCRKQYHVDLCVGGPLPEECDRDRWICPKCRCDMKKTGNSCSTPVRALDSIDHLNVTLRRKTNIPTTDVDQLSFDCTKSETAELLMEIRQFRTEIKSLRSEFSAFQSEMREMSISIKAYGERVDTVETKVTQLEQRIDTKEKSNKEEVQTLKQYVLELESRLNEKEQESLLCDVEISGVSEQKGENVYQITRLVAAKLGVTLEDKDIVCAYRRGKSNTDDRGRTIALRLTRRSLRDELLKNARVRRKPTTANMQIPGEPTPFYLNERLTQTNYKLLKKARELGKEKGWKYIWTNNGQVLARQAQDGA